MELGSAWGLLKRTFDEWNEDKAPRLAAALAFYAMSSIAPLLVIIISIAGLIFDPNEVRGQINGQLGTLVGQTGAEAIDALIQGAQKQSSGIVATILGLVTLVLAAGGFFGQLQDALNTIWEVAPKPTHGLWEMVRRRFAPFTMVLGIGFLLLISLVVSAALSAFSGLLLGQDAASQFFWQAVTFVVSFGITTLLFAMIYRVLPDVEIAWRDVWFGAAITALLFSIGRLLISFYLAHTATESSYGAAGSLVIVLIWIYYSAQILFFGAELTQVYARQRGARIVPSPHAVSLREEDRAEQGLPHQEEVERRAGQPSGQRAQPVGAAGRMFGSLVTAALLAAMISRQARAEGQRQRPGGLPR